jgi:hypothetical protein
MTGLSSYPKVWRLGHRQVANLFEPGKLVIQEKIDGSQLSFGFVDGTLRVRSKGVQQNMDAPDKMFENAIATIKDRFKRGLLIPGWTYRGEYLKKPKHNVLAYDGIPHGHIALFDVQTTTGNYLAPEEVEKEATHMELGCVPVLDVRTSAPTEEELREYLTITSYLGGPIEGVVIKNYDQYTPIDGTPCFAKYVAESFKESHKREWKTEGKKELVDGLIFVYSSPMRFHKAVQHLREAGKLTDDLPDIGPLMEEVKRDLVEECKEEIKEKLWEHYERRLLNGVSRGLPSWYKEFLSRPGDV